MKLVILDGGDIVPQLPWRQEVEGSRIPNIDYYDNTPAHLALERMRGAQLVLTNKVVISASMIDELPELKYIGVMATGYNVVDVAAAARHGITVTNIPAYSTDSVAQHTWALILNVFNKVDYYAVQNRDGRWCRNVSFCYYDYPIHELAGLTLGVVGLGSIGMKVAKIALAFGMKVLAVTSKPQESLPSGIRAAKLETLLSESDVISLHCPLTEANREMINGRTLSLCKTGAVLVNTGRGGLVNEHDIACALKQGCISAYCADVLSQEPASPDNPLISVENCFITPHIAWASVEARERLVKICKHNISAFLDGHPVNVVS
ncbi:MAG: D-2-hydroxyacid dehydrogenase [Bacteroidaceae bacterium]|nr:D-2-hydroxyacid dehydrogenase [Bacteroidaceae bacterium]